MEMLAYGRYHCRHASGREGGWFRLGMAGNKNYIALDISAANALGCVAERHTEAVPRANIEESCVRFDRLGELDQDALKRMTGEGAPGPGEGVGSQT